MKIAITGKGGVGKSTLAGILAHLAQRDGKQVLAVDSDPDANLGLALGIPEAELATIIPISQRQELIEERTGAKLKEFGQIFKLNPRVSDIADRFGHDHKGIQLLVLGAIEAGGSGCACPENVFLRNLLSSIILERDQFVIVDMEAGIEHLGRSTVKGIDQLIIVVEPTSTSIGTARKIIELAGQIGLHNISLVGNKIASTDEQQYLIARFEASPFIGFIPHVNAIRKASIDSTPLIDILDSEALQAFRSIYANLGIDTKTLPSKTDQASP